MQTIRPTRSQVPRGDFRARWELYPAAGRDRTVHNSAIVFLNL